MIIIIIIIIINIIINIIIGVITINSGYQIFSGVECGHGSNHDA